MANQTLTLVKLTPHRQVIGSKWVFRVKENPDESVDKYKARLIEKEYHQQHNFDFNKTF